VEQVPNLSSAERHVLEVGLGAWGGPATLTEGLARALGFRSLSDFDAKRIDLKGRIQRQQPLSALEWTEVLVLSEIAFISDVFGAGVEWSISTPFSDEETLIHIRSIQKKLVSVTVPL
jgi:hypothetical protein